MSSQTLVQRLFQIQTRLRAVENLQEARFVLVNETRSLVAYRQVVLWEKEEAVPTAVSGLAEVNRQAPYTIFLVSLFKWLERSQTKPSDITREMVPRHLSADWAEFMPEHVFWLPISGASML